MTRAQMLYLVIVLVATALALIPLTLIIVSKRPAHSEPVMIIIPYKSMDDGIRFAGCWQEIVQGMTGLSLVS